MPPLVLSLGSCNAWAALSGRGKRPALPTRSGRRSIRGRARPAAARNGRQHGRRRDGPACAGGCCGHGCSRGRVCAGHACLRRARALPSRRARCGTHARRAPGRGDAQVGRGLGLCQRGAATWARACALLGGGPPSERLVVAAMRGRLRAWHPSCGGHAAADAPTGGRVRAALGARLAGRAPRCSERRGPQSCRHELFHPAATARGRQRTRDACCTRRCGACRCTARCSSR